MSLYSLISSLLSYVFTTIIYLFIFSVIALIYMDIKKMNRSGDENGDEYPDEETAEEASAVLRTLKTKKSVECRMKAFYRIGEEPVVVGRGKNCDIVIPDMFLSVEHFHIWYEDGEWYIGDMGSKNGTFLNDKELKKVMPLNDGDEISFGGLAVVFEIE